MGPTEREYQPRYGEDCCGGIGATFICFCGGDKKNVKKAKHRRRGAETQSNTDLRSRDICPMTSGATRGCRDTNVGFSR